MQKGSTRLRPLSQALKVASQGCSIGLEEIIVDLGAEDSFALATGRLLRHHGIKLSESTVRKVTLRHAQSMYENKRLDVLNGTLPSKGADVVIAQADGTMLPVVEVDQSAQDARKSRSVKWEESKLCAAVKAGDKQAVYGFGESVEELGIRWADCVEQAGAGVDSHIHVVCDGAPWIRQQAEQCLGQNTTVTLDFFHACDYLAACSKSTAFKEDGDWFETQKECLRKGESAELINLLKKHVESDGISDERAPIRTAYRYFSNRAGQLDYASVL